VLDATHWEGVGAFATRSYVSWSSGPANWGSKTRLIRKTRLAHSSRASTCKRFSAQSTGERQRLKSV